MAGERFTLEIFADTSAASAALKNFAREQETIARRLRTEAQTPAQAKALAAPQFQQLGYATRALGVAQQAGTIPEAEVKALRAQIAQQAAQLRAGLVEAGLTDKEARGAQQSGYLAGQRQANADLLAAREAEAAATRAATAEKTANATEEAALSEQVQDAQKAERDAIRKQLAATLARARQELALSQDPSFLQAQATLAASRERVRTSVAQDPGVQQARAERIAAEAAVKNAAAADAATQATVKETLARKILAERLARQAATAAALSDPVLQAQMADRLAAEKVATNSARAKAAADEGVTASLAQRLAAERSQAAYARARVFSDENYIKALTERTVQERLANKIARERAAADIRLIAAQQSQLAAASPFQRAYGRITGSPVANAPTGGQFFGRKFATTAGYGLSSIALFGAVGGVAKVIQEAEALDRVMNDIGFQLESFRNRGLDVPGIDEVRAGILEIARTTGLAADEVGRVAFQLQGAFGGDTVRALRETTAAAEFVRLTGLSLEETIDSFTALTQAFEDGTLSAREFGDTAFGLQERFGVLAPQILDFAADLAPVAEAAGFTVQELQALGAAAQKFSGRPGSALSEAFGRIIPQVQERAAEFIGLFQQTPSLRPFADDIADAFASGDIQEVFSILLASYNDLSRTQKNFVIDLLGGRREAASLVGVLENGSEVLNEWSGQYNDTGKQADKFSARQETLTQQLALFGEQLSQLGIQIFESGLKDLFEFILDSGGGVVAVLSDIVSTFSGLNSALGGIPGQVLAIVAALKLLQAAANTALAGRILGGLGAGGGGRGGGFGNLFASSLTSFTPFLNLYGGAAGAATGPTTLSGRAPINGVDPLNQRGAFRSALQAQGPRATANAFWQNASQGLRDSFSANKGLIAATGLVLGSQLFGELTASMRREAEGQGRSRVSGLGEQLAAGLTLSSDEIARLEREAARGGLSNAQRVRDSVGNVPIVGELVAAGISVFARGQDRNQAAAAEARRILAGEVAADLQVSVDAIRNAGLLGVEEGLRIFTVSDGQQSFVSGENLQRIVDKAAAGEALTPGEYQILEQLQQSIPRAIERNAAIAEAVLGDEFEQSFGRAVENLEAVTARYEAGGATRGEYLIALGRAARGAQALVDRGLADPEQLAQQLEIINRSRQEISQGMLDEIETLGRYESFQTGTEDLGATSRRLAAAIRSGRLTAEDQATALEQWFTTQQEILAGQGEGASRAVPAFIRAAAIAQQLSSNTAFQIFAGGISETAENAIGDTGEMLDEISAIMVAGNLGVRDAYLAWLDDQIEFYNDIASASPRGPSPSLISILDGLRAERRRAAESGKLNKAQVEDPRRVRAEQESLEDRASEAADRAAAMYTYLESLTEDPVELARIAVARAQDALRRARGTTEILQARAELNNAQRGLRDAIRDVYDSQFDLLATIVENDPVRAARVGLAQANEAVRRAVGAAARNRALAEQITARRQLQDAINDVIASQIDLAIAVADAAGNTVQSARLALRQAQTRLRQLQQSGAGRADLNRARADVITAQAGVRDALLGNRQDYYQFLYDMGRITTGQLITYLQSLLAIPNLTQQQVRDIQLQIKQLRDQLGQDFQFNLPTELALPTFYETRRADQTGSRAFTDNRVVTVNVNVAESADLTALESVLADAVGGSNVQGTITRRY